MSIKVQSWVWENSDAKGSQLLLLLAIADHAHDDGCGAFPSVQSLAKKCRQTERNTQFLLRELEANFEIITRPQAGPHGCNIYIIPVPWNEPTWGEKISGVKNSAKNIRQISPESSVTVLSNNTGDEIFDDAVPEQAPHRTAEEAKASLRATLANPDLGQGAAKSSAYDAKRLFIEQAVTLMRPLCSKSGLNDKTKPQYAQYAQLFLDDPPLWSNNTRVTPEQIIAYLARQVSDGYDYGRPQFVYVTVTQELAKMKPSDLDDPPTSEPKTEKNAPDLSFMDNLQ